MSEQINFPDIIYANKKVGTNGVHCLDYRNYENDIEYRKQKQLPSDIAQLVEKMEINAHLEIGMSLFAPMLKRLAQYIKTGE